MSLSFPMLITRVRLYQREEYKEALGFWMQAVIAVARFLGPVICLTSFFFLTRK